MIRMTRKMFLLGLLISSLPLFLFSQESHKLLEKQYYFPNGSNYNNEELYGLALQYFEAEEATDEHVMLTAMNSFKIDETRSIDLLLESIARSNDAIKNNDLYAIIANKYFAKNEYKTARKYYLKLNQKILTKDQYEEANFKLAYTYLLEKNFQESLGYFLKSKKYKGKYTDDANYYSGICFYFLNEKEKAIAQFESVQNHNRYRDLIPYYLAQIYFKDGNYAHAIVYGERKLKDGSSTDLSHVRKILGLSYLAKENYQSALKHLDAYARETPKLTENEFYQIANAHYNLGDYESAKPLFLELSHQATAIGQVSNYLLGSIYLKSVEKKNAQSAFKQASKYNYFEDIREESQYLYYKISADLGEERIAINGLSKMTSTSPYYEESQNLLADLLVRSTDYLMALNTIEGLDSKTQKISSTYKSLSYDYGLQNLDENSLSTAIEYLKISETTPGENSLTDKSKFWLGLAYDHQEDQINSGKYLQSYMETSNQNFRFRAYYLRSYQIIQDKNFTQAKSMLEKAMASFRADKDEKSLFDDAIVRLADLELLDNNYNKAIEYYDLAIDNQAEASDYILYQKSLIYGVIGEHLDKLTSLEKLINKYPESEYRDDALFEIGESLLSLKKNNEAFKIFKALVQEFGSDSEYAALSYLRQGLISYNQGDINSALDYYKQGMDLSTDADHKRQALMAIEEIYLNDKNDPDSYFDYSENEVGFKVEDYTRDSISYNLSLEAYQESRFSEAIQGLRKYLNNFKEGLFRDEASYYIAESYVLLKDYDNALRYYEDLIEDNSTKYAKTSLKKAALITFNHQKDFEKSHRLFESLIATSEDPGINIYESALYSAFKVNDDNAMIRYGAIIIDSPDADDSKKSAAHFYTAVAYERKGEPDNAIVSYKKVIQLSDNNQASESSYRVALLLYKMEKLEQAELQAFETTKKAANYPFWVAKSLILIGDIYTVKKDYLNASAAYESVIENFKENQKIIEEATDKLETLVIMIKLESRVKEPESLDLIQQDNKR